MLIVLSLLQMLHLMTADAQVQIPSPLPDFTVPVLPADQNGDTNILLLGDGDPDHPASYLTDSMMIASIRPSDRSVSLLSLPRDLYLTDTTDTPEDRINALFVHKRDLHIGQGYSQDQAQQMALTDTADELSKRLQIPIHGVIKVDFTAFKDVIDAFGGVDVDVPETLTDYEYPISEKSFGTFTIEKGLQHLDGKTALEYSRSRHSTSDFDRAGRQQQVLQALLTKAKSQNVLSDIGTLQSLLVSLQGKAEWTLNSAQIATLAGVMMTVPQDRIISMHLNNVIGSDSTDTRPGGMIVSGADRHIASGAILLPYSLTWAPTDWAEIRTMAHMLFDYRELYLDHTDITLAADPSEWLQRHRLENELTRYGLTVKDGTGMMRASGSGWILGSRNTDAETEKMLPILTGLPWTSTDPKSQTGSTVQIILGNDYRFTPFEKTLGLESPSVKKEQR